MCGVIYKITNLLNGKIYVGQTINFHHCMQQHKSRNRIGVDAAIKKYGRKNFSVEVMEECSVEKLEEREMFWIVALKIKVLDGYNLTNESNSLRDYVVSTNYFNHKSIE